MAKTTRPKGYLRVVSKLTRDPDEWCPSPEVLELIDNTRTILAEYSSYGPMTVRQVFYRMVGAYGYDKTEKAYNRLAEALVKARRAQLISFGSIRDDGGTTQGGSWGWENVEEFFTDLERYSTSFRLDPILGQPHHVIVYCEAEGMVPMLAQMTRNWGVHVTGTGGFSSLTVTHRIAMQVCRRDKQTIFLHVGDYDPSGESIFESTCQDIGKFVAETVGARYRPHTGETIEVGGEQFEWGCEGSFFIPRRVALTGDQVEEYGIETSPPKASDTRTANWSGDEAAQAEAIPPDLLDTIINEAVREWVDHDVREENDERSETIAGKIGSRVEDAIKQVRVDLEDEADDEDDE